MVNPLELLAHRSRARAASARLRRVRVDVPTDVPGTDAIFLMLRRMRGPLILVVAIFTFCVVGLSLMPGTDDAGRPHHLTIFDAFYVMSYTATTIGFGEIPYPFSYAQRLWVTLSIYLTVTGWAYAISALFGLFQGGIVPSYALIVREYFSPKEAGARVGTVLMATLFGMALGGWMSGAVFDLTGSYRAAFLNGIAWNLLNISIVCFLLYRARSISSSKG